MYAWYVRPELELRKIIPKKIFTVLYLQLFPPMKRNLMCRKNVTLLAVSIHARGKVTSLLPEQPQILKLLKEVTFYSLKKAIYNEFFYTPGANPMKTNFTYLLEH